MADFVLMKKKVGGVIRKVPATNKKKIQAFKEQGFEIITQTNLKKEMDKPKKGMVPEYLKPKKASTEAK